MGCDVYAGTLTRYYSDDWETVWARHARETGMQNMTVRVDERGIPDVQRINPKEGHDVLAWREALNEAILDAPGNPRLDWDEGVNRPYFTAKLGWNGYAALMLHAAHAMRPEIGRPEAVPEDWREDEAYKASTGENLSGSPCCYVMAPELWLPGTSSSSSNARSSGATRSSSALPGRSSLTCTASTSEPSAQTLRPPPADSTATSRRP